MDARDINDALSDLGRELGQRGLPALRLLMVGGAYMVT